MAVKAKAKAIKKPAIGNVSSDAVTQQEPMVVEQEPLVMIPCKCEPEAVAVGGLPPQGKLPKPRVAGTKRRKRQPVKKSLLKNPLVLVGIGLAAVFVIGSIANGQASSMEKSMMPPVDGFASTDEYNSEVSGWRHR